MDKRPVAAWLALALAGLPPEVAAAAYRPEPFSVKAEPQDYPKE
jgi:hypothetical protein